jgi:hypothetical protein
MIHLSPIRIAAALEWRATNVWIGGVLRKCTILLIYNHSMVHAKFERYPDRYPVSPIFKQIGNKICRVHFSYRKDDLIMKEDDLIFRQVI